MIMYGPHRELEIYGTRVALHWGLNQSILMLCEVAFYCPDIIIEHGQDRGRRVLRINEHTPEQKNQLRQYITESAQEIYREWVGFTSDSAEDENEQDENEQDENEDEGGHTRRQRETTTELAGRLATALTEKKAANGGVVAPGARDRIFLHLVNLVEPENSHQLADMLVNAMGEAYARYDRDALCFIEKRMKHHLLGGAVQPMLPIPLPTADSPHWGPRRAEAFTPKPQKAQR